MRSSERPAMHTLAPGLARDPADRLQPRGVGGEGRDEHAALGLRHLREQPGMDALLGSGRLVLEDVGGIAHEREHALVADLRQHLGARRLADHRRLVDLPVAGVEDVAERRLDQQAVAFRDRVRQRDEADLERPELDAPAALDDVELDAAGQPFLLELAGDQPGGERRRVTAAPSAPRRGTAARRYGPRGRESGRSRQAAPAGPR